MLTLLLGDGLAAWGQTPIPSTPYTRGLLRATNAETARTILGVASTNDVVDWATNPATTVTV
jgi:hypothetical protein